MTTETETFFLPKTHERKRDGATVDSFYDIIVDSLPADLQKILDKRTEIVAALVSITEEAEKRLVAVAPRLAIRQKDGRIGKILHPGDVPVISWNYGKVAMKSASPAVAKRNSGGAVLL